MSTQAITVKGCSKWYGHVLGVSEISWTISGGIVGLLGPNGAGKSTLMKMIVGLLKPSRGEVEVFGQSPWENAGVRARIGYCPEHENMYDELSATEFVTAMAELSGLDNAAKRADEALEKMGLSKAKRRLIGGFSKGMRQRTKLATCLVHDPDLLILDEPLTGVDPLARTEIIEHIRNFAAEGKTVVISSHVLYEIESLTEDILVVYRGQVLAEGNLYEIRTLIDKHPHRIRVDCDRPRDLARKLVDHEHISRIGFERGVVIIETVDPDRCYDELGAVLSTENISVRSLTSPDNNLGAVFEYLTGGHA